MINFDLAAGPKTINGKSEATALSPEEVLHPEAKPSQLKPQVRGSSTSASKPPKAKQARRTQEPTREQKPASLGAALTSSGGEVIPDPAQHAMPLINAMQSLAGSPPFGRK